MRELFSIERTSTGKAIKAYRKAFKFSQSQIADLIGSSQAIISKIESGKRRLGLDIAVKFCAIFNINLEDILFPNGIEHSNSYIETRKRIDTV